MTDFAVPSVARTIQGGPAGAQRPTLLVLSHLRWDFVTQRPQHLMTRAARDFDVIFFEEPLWDDAAAPGVDDRQRDGGIRVVQPLLPHGTDTAAAVDYQRGLLDRLVARVSGSLILWFYTPMALPFARHLAADLIVFDKMDELSAFQNAPPLLLALEQELLELADVVFTGGASMHEAAAHRHENIHCFPSSIDAAHFAKAREGGLDDPADQAGIAEPRIGFFGVIDERFDIGLLREVATAAPEMQFVMIGPVVKIDPASLPQAANIHWLGGKTYAELPAYLAGWHVGWMPFAINDATKFISPTKTPEFLAAGLAVVSTAIRDVVRPYGEAGLVEIAATRDETLTAFAKVLGRPRRDWLAAVDAHLAQGSWDKTWDAMRAQMNVILGGTTVPGREMADV
ncbi:glycosyltransferase family protein [Glacieibacterium frigidum]|uniref:Glycosyltransferase family 1 protein n=1 Tax=Glacieibacterium frigidum TaxID=2593303 RepID=A0A552U8M3_9SPHN|nr:glycosyltransferase family 1 protein [Glacieibacterium frigidum]TRW14539.1 glycosyltransferase family 1 protein [Glacieibacterium frigidum]